MNLNLGERKVPVSSETFRQAWYHISIYNGTQRCNNPCTSTELIISFGILLGFLVPNFGKSALIWREIQTTWSALCFCLFFDDSQFLSHSTCERVIFLISPERSYWSQLCSPKKNRYGRGSRWVLVSVVGPIFSLWTSGIYHYYDSRPKKKLYTSPKRLE